MRTAIATVCVSGTLREKLEAIAAAGFAAVEIFEADLLAFPGKPSDVRGLCADLGLTIATCQPFRDFEGMPAGKRERAFLRAERKFDLLQELGTDLMFVCSNVAPDALGGVDRMAEDFRELGERAARRGMRVAYEALAWGRHVSDWRDSWEIVRRAGHPAVTLALDSFHILARGTDIGPLRLVPGDRIGFVQLADAPRLSMDYLSWARHWRCMPGQGDFDLIGFMSALDTTGYQGWLSLEIFNDRFRAASAEAVALDGRRSLLWLQDATSRLPGRAADPAPKMPAPQAVAQVEFIEFVTDAGERDALEALLSGMGFARVGRHRSKDVALWRQGRIAIVVNAEAGGFAGAYHTTHGTSVCALGLQVADARLAVARAAALLDPPHRSEIGPGELEIPAVRGLGESLVYFVDGSSDLSRWAEIDFEPTGATAAGVGLMGVDHVSQTMQYEEMLTWLLFYVSLLEAWKAPSQAVLDPGGVVQSQPVESGLDRAGGGFRLILNGSQSARTQAGRFVKESFGSGVQHIALSTRDIRTTVRALVAAGVEMLPIPENYYDDLEARTELPPDEIEALRALNILYDQDSHGVFQQAYVNALSGGFFFEIVQRDGYGGYGGPNAGIRLAAQSRIAQHPIVHDRRTGGAKR
jgi:4-hydroxyphenylpyruvate dioxygenase